jgi:hypothetical protein
MRMAWPGATFESMQAVRRLAAPEAGVIADAGVGIAAAALIAIAAWGPPPGLAGTGMIPGSSSFFGDARLFPAGSATLDCALLMRDIPATWTAMTRNRERDFQEFPC